MRTAHHCAPSLRLPQLSRYQAAPGLAGWRAPLVTYASSAQDRGGGTASSSCVRPSPAARHAPTTTRPRTVACRHCVIKTRAQGKKPGDFPHHPKSQDTSKRVRLQAVLLSPTAVFASHKQSSGHRQPSCRLLTLTHLPGTPHFLSQTGELYRNTFHFLTAHEGSRFWSGSHKQANSFIPWPAHSHPTASSAATRASPIPTLTPPSPSAWTLGMQRVPPTTSAARSPWPGMQPSKKHPTTTLGARVPTIASSVPRAPVLPPGTRNEAPRLSQSAMQRSTTRSLAACASPP